MSNTPFIFFEYGGKTESRAIKCLQDHPDPVVRRWSQSVQVHTLGAKYSPFRINYFDLEGQVSAEENTERILDSYQGSIPMEGSMLALLGEAVEKRYRDCPDLYRHPPKAKGILKAVRQVLQDKDYSAEMKSDLMTAITTRLGVLTRRSMGYIFSGTHNTPTIEQLVTGNHIIELSRLSPAQQAFVTLILLTGICQYVRTTEYSGPGPRLMLFLEEAHNVIGASTEARASETNADPKAFASELIAGRMLAELRGEKVGVVILNQLVTAIAPEVLKNVGTKIVCGVGDGDEREVTAAAMLFNDIETRDIARLTPGQCYFLTERYFAPRKLQCPDVKSIWEMPAPPKNDAILPYIKDEQWFIDNTNKVIADEMEQLDQEMNDFNDSLRDLIDQTMSLGANRSSRGSTETATQARTLHKHIEQSWDIFFHDIYRPLTSTMIIEGVVADRLVEKRSQLIARFESTVRPAVLACLTALDMLTGDHK